MSENHTFFMSEVRRFLRVAVETPTGLKEIELPLLFDKRNGEYIVPVPKEHTELARDANLPDGVWRRFVNGFVLLHSSSHDRILDAVKGVERAARTHQPAPTSPSPKGGIYIASRASIPARAAQWRLLRDILGWHIVSTWIDEAGPGETQDFAKLWVRIESEVKQAERVILYVESDDFPLKGALIEVGMALAAGVKVFVVAPGLMLEPRTRRPLGSWIDHPLVTLVPNMDVALQGAARRPVTA